MKDVHDAAVREDILGRLTALRPDSEPSWGTMTPGVMLFHLNAGMRMALGELAAEPVGDPAFWHTKGKAIALGDAPWPEGAPTSREALPEGPVDIEAEREQFAMLLESIAARDPRLGWPGHPRLGPLTGAEWSRLMYTHVQHHFRQFRI